MEFPDDLQAKIKKIAEEYKNLSTEAQEEFNQEFGKYFAEKLAMEIIGVDPLDPPDSLKKILYERYGGKDD